MVALICSRKLPNSVLQGLAMTRCVVRLPCLLRLCAP